MTCPFCRAIENGDIFFASAHFAGIANIAPIVPGHSLLVPRRHIERLTQLGPKELAELAPAAHQVGEILGEAFRSTGVNWSIQDGSEAGQTVLHLHLHILPRCHGDMPAPGDWYPRVERWDKEILGSARRPRLPDDARAAITLRLRDIARKRGFKN